MFKFSHHKKAWCIQVALSALHYAPDQKLDSPILFLPNLTRVAKPKQKKLPQNCLDKHILHPGAENPRGTYCSFPRLSWNMKTNLLSLSVADQFLSSLSNTVEFSVPILR